MIDRMFIQEEKMALNQDRILAKEKPGKSDRSLPQLVMLGVGSVMEFVCVLGSI